MNAETRFTILPFPQEYDANNNTIRLRIVVLPRNQNPLLPAMDPPTAGVVPFAEAQLAFEASIISGLANFPYDQLQHDTRQLVTNAPPNAKALFEMLKKKFKIQDVVSNQTIPAVPENAPKSIDASVKKYLPLSYRQAFNFTTSRHPNAVTDDSYRCAVRDAGLVPGFKRSPDLISWGKVFAYALKHRLLAEQLGMIYETTIENATQFAKGGWVYIDLAAGSDYQQRHQTNPHFVKRYAARVPPLTGSRNLFTPILFPVLFKANPAAPDPDLPDGFDELFVEAAEYDDGLAKIVHAHQPRSRNLLLEEADGAHPVKDVGIRLGWDDEQILIWYIRQLTEGPVDNERLDAPLGIFGYCIDVRETSEAPGAVNPWISQNAVRANEPLTLEADGDTIELGPFEDELPYQVYPSQLDGDKNKSYWLPMYFANWNGMSMVLPDDEAAGIYQNKNLQLTTYDETRTAISGPVKNQANEIYTAVGIDPDMLRYGRQYDFRIRLRDISGGGIPPGPPLPDEKTTTCRFRRFVAPNQPRLTILDPNSDKVEQVDELELQRPLLGYPAVKYTDPARYADPVGLLATAAQANTGHAFGISDPDVDRVEVTVEVQALRMDNLLSVSGKENYVHLYTTQCLFPAVNNEADLDATLTIPIVYRDCKVLHTAENDKNLTADLGLPADIDELNQLVLPRGRTVRLSIRSVCEEKVNNDDYYGLINNNNHDMDVRYSPVIQVLTSAPMANEEDLFVDSPSVPRLQGVYLQPDPPQLFDGTVMGMLLGQEVQKPPDMIERLAKQLDLESRGLTLTAQRGERVQFGCSQRIRHILSPENSSITFSSKGDLMNHWLCCFSVQINRDWTWDGLEDRAFVVKRSKRFTHDKVTETEEGEVGDIEIRHTAPFEALQDAKRNYTRLVFIDAVEPKNPRKREAPNADKPRFPDTIEVTYTVETKFKPGHGAQNDGVDEQRCTLPITTPPTQVPKIVGAGIALSPYERNPEYSLTYPRRRYLWVEFEEPIEDPNDHVFARVLAYAPDQLISDNRPELFIAPEEPPLPIDPEYIRFVREGSANDLAGLKAMQPMKKAKDSNRHYLLPLPSKLHENADELFGFFTYEFRVGHYKDASTPEANDFVWSTAQGRFGRRLRVTGIQHPAPQLTCMVDRDDEKIYVAAPYAVAVANGKNVTADPPRTDLWCLLYAQVKQADNRDFRNILIDNKRLDRRVQVEHNRDVNPYLLYTRKERDTLKLLNILNWNDELSYAKMSRVLKLTDTTRVNKDSVKHGTAVWSNTEVVQMLEAFGLPGDSSLSVLVVEFLPVIRNVGDHIRQPGQEEVRQMTIDLYREIIKSRSDMLGLPVHLLEASGEVPEREREPSPVAEALGKRRILRTSPLTEVPFVCCTNC